MAHSVGALLLPAPIASDDESVTDPMLDVVAPYFAEVLRHYFGKAWNAVAPNEPVVRRVSKHDPEETDFAQRDLPLLCVWREADSRPKHLTDLHGESESTVRILWVPPPATQDKTNRRHSFFNAFTSAITLAVQHERDPCWRHPNDVENDDAESEAYGSDVLRLAGISWWAQQGTSRTQVVISAQGVRQAHPAYLASLTIGEMSVSDEAAFGVSPTVIAFEQRSGGGNLSRPIFDSLVPPDAPSL